MTSLGIRQLFGGLRQDSRAEWVECLLTNSRLLHSVTSAFTSALREARTLAKVSACGGRPLPRAYLAVRAYLAAVQDKFQQETFVVFIGVMQERMTFDMDELWVFKPLLQLRLMQRLLQIGSELDSVLDREILQKLSSELGTILESLRELDHANWDRIFSTRTIARGKQVHPLPEGVPLSTFAPGGEGAMQLQRNIDDFKLAGIGIRITNDSRIALVRTVVRQH